MHPRKFGGASHRKAEKPSPQNDPVTVLPPTVSSFPFLRRWKVFSPSTRRAENPSTEGTAFPLQKRIMSPGSIFMASASPPGFTSRMAAPVRPFSLDSRPLITRLEAEHPARHRFVSVSPKLHRQAVFAPDAQSIRSHQVYPEVPAGCSP